VERVKAAATYTIDSGGDTTVSEEEIVGIYRSSGPAARPSLPARWAPWWGEFVWVVYRLYFNPSKQANNNPDVRVRVQLRRNLRGIFVR
jgi:hypothetical protein